MNDFIGTVLLALLCLISISLGVWLGNGMGYRQGQIDALNGKIYYELKRQENNAFTWEECPDVCEVYKK